MRTQGIRNFALPAILATAAAALTVIYVSHGGPKNAAAAAGTNGVYVATRDLAAGVSGDDVMHALRLVHVPTDAVVPGAVTNSSQLAGRILLTSVYRGQQLTQRAFGATRQQGLAGQLTGRFRAIQIAGDQNQVLAGTLRDGDHVDIVASLKRGSGQLPYGRTVLRDILGMHAPPAPSSGPGASTTLSTTLRLTDAQAQTLFFVTKNGDWSLVLRPVVHGSNSSDFVDSIGSVLEAGR
jgi:Flp pilus assembly protein CpaB